MIRCSIAVFLAVLHSGLTVQRSVGLMPSVRGIPSVAQTQSLELVRCAFAPRPFWTGSLYDPFPPNRAAVSRLAWMMHLGAAAAASPQDSNSPEFVAAGVPLVFAAALAVAMSPQRPARAKEEPQLGMLLDFFQIAVAPLRGPQGAASARDLALQFLLPDFKTRDVLSNFHQLLKQEANRHVLPPVPDHASIQVLALGGVGENAGPSAFLIRTRSAEVLIDAGLAPIRDEGRRIPQYRWLQKAPDAIFLTHGHMDHVGSWIWLAEHWRQRGKTIPVYATAPTILLMRDGMRVAMKRYQSNAPGALRQILPPMSSDNIDTWLNRIHPIQVGKPVRITRGMIVTPHAVPHLAGSVGYLVDSENGTLFHSGDMTLESPGGLPAFRSPRHPVHMAFLESSMLEDFPASCNNRLEGLAREVGHLLEGGQHVVLKHSPLRLPALLYELAAHLRPGVKFYLEESSRMALRAHKMEVPSLRLTGIDYFDVRNSLKGLNPGVHLTSNGSFRVPPSRDWASLPVPNVFYAHAAPLDLEHMIAGLLPALKEVWLIHPGRIQVQAFLQKRFPDLSIAIPVPGVPVNLPRIIATGEKSRLSPPRKIESAA